MATPPTRDPIIAYHVIQHHSETLSIGLQNIVGFARQLLQRGLLRPTSLRDIMHENCLPSQQLNIIFRDIENMWFKVPDAFDLFLEALNSNPPNKDFVSKLLDTYSTCIIIIIIN